MGRSLDSIQKLNAILEPQCRIQEQLERILKPQRSLLEEQVARILEPQYRAQEQLARILEPQDRIQEQLARILEPQHRIQEQLARILEPYRIIQGKMAHILEPQRQLQEITINYLTPLSELLSNPLMQEFSISDNGEISVAGELVDVDIVSNSLEGLPVNCQDAEALLAWFFAHAAKLSEFVRVVFLYIVLPSIGSYIISIAANLTTPIYQELIDSRQSTDQRSTKKEIVREANELYDTSELVGYRFVYATELHVRESHSTHSDIIDGIPLGKNVKLIGKRKRWSFIEYHDSDTGEIKHGWVFSRYLKKFSR